MEPGFESNFPLDLPNLFHLGKIVRVNKLLCRGNQGRNSWIDGEGLWISEDHQEAWPQTVISLDGVSHIFLRFCTNEFRQHAILCFILLCLVVFYNQDLFSAGWETQLSLYCSPAVSCWSLGWMHRVAMLKWNLRLSWWLSLSHWLFNFRLISQKNVIVKDNM